MNRLRSFLVDQRGNATVRLAITAATLSFVAVLGAISLDRSARDGTLTRYAQSVFGKGGQVQTAANRPRGQYDYTPTGTVAELTARNVLLDPCLGLPKN